MRRSLVSCLFAAAVLAGPALAQTTGQVIGKFGRAGKLPKEFGSVNALNCRAENELYVGEIGNWRVQKLTLHNN